MMSNSPANKVTRKLILLAVMLVFLAALSFTNVMKQSVASAEPLICCSACDVENPPLACRHGCSPSCKE
jgi:hypothetical protein